MFPSKSSSDPYKTLGVTHDASSDEITILIGLLANIDRADRDREKKNRNNGIKSTRSSIKNKNRRRKHRGNLKQQKK
jgi:hypothetical protein